MRGSIRTVLGSVMAGALLVGTPFALASWVGNPFPSQAPTAASLVGAFTEGQVSEATLVKALAWICWLAWAELVVAVVVEARARRRGQAAPRLPALGTAQAVAAVLVTALSPALGIHDRSGGISEPAPLARALALAPPLGHELRGIPETFGGSPAGGTARPADGSRPMPSRDVIEGPLHQVQRRDTLWSVAEARLGDALRWRDIYELNHGRPQWDGAGLARPDQPLHEGWTLALPADARPPAAADRPVLEAPATPTSEDVTEVLEIVAVGDADVVDGSVLEGLAGATLAAGGFVWSIDRLRRSAERRRLPGEVTSRRPRLEERTEMGVRAAADTSLVTLTDRALRAWAARVHADGRRPPAVVGINLAEELSLLFAAPEVDPVDGFFVEDDGMSWVTSLDAHGASDIDGVPHPLPCLVTIGYTERSQVLINLQLVDILQVTGEESEVDETLFAIASELASGPTASEVQVIVLGTDADLTALPGVLTVGHPHELERWAARRPQPVVVFAPSISVEEHQQLVALARQGPSMRFSLVSTPAGDSGANLSGSWCLEVARSHVTLEPVGVRLNRVGIPATARPAVSRLLHLHPPDPGHEPVPPLVAALSPAGELEPEVELCVLGNVEVRGAAEVFPRRKALEFVTYLAFHRRGVDADTLAEALWPDRLASPRTLHGIATLARRALGSGVDGEPLLPHAGAEGNYRVSPSLGVDFERFSALARADANGPGGEIRNLRGALALVKGRPFTVSRGEYLWVHAEALMTAVVAEVADAAHRLALLCLDNGDARGAHWATQQGLLASPGNEQLYRDRMLVADLSGNPAGIEEVVDELCLALEVPRGNMRKTLHPLTVELYERISRRAATRALVARSASA